MWTFSNMLRKLQRTLSRGMIPYKVSITGSGLYLCWWAKVYAKTPVAQFPQLPKPPASSRAHLPLFPLDDPFSAPEKRVSGWGRVVELLGWCQSAGRRLFPSILCLLIPNRIFYLSACIIFIFLKMSIGGIKAEGL